MHLDSIFMFDKAGFFSHLNTRIIAKNYWEFTEMVSTNSFLKKIDSDILPHGLLCQTFSQTKGRGQGKREWESQPGKNLTFSIVVKPDDASRIQLLLQVMAYSVVLAIEDVTGIRASLKWPNDLLIGEKKVAGILAEGSFVGDKPDRFILGTGINVNQQNYSHKNKEIAVSLFNCTGKIISLEHLLAKICNNFEQEYDDWKKKSTQQLQHISRLFPGYGEFNQIELNGERKMGLYKFLGLDINGQLLFLNENDELIRIMHEHIRFNPV